MASLSPETILRQMEKMASSRTFRPAARQSSFLRYVVEESIEGRGHLLKEYSIGVAVFRKKESFDPRLDSIVRTEARKLRVRLARYFEGEGKDDPVRIELPLGRYVPAFSGAGERTELTPGRRPLLFHVSSRNRAGLRIAVLPFVNRGASQRDEYFTDGLTDELSHAFTRVQGLEVVARTSAFQFKGRPIDIREVGQRLNVHALVEGSVRRSGQRVRILAQLDDAIQGDTVWSQSYDRRLADLLDVQQEIAATITDELGNHFHVSKALQAPARRQQALASAEPAVYQEYLQGLYLWNRHTLEGFDAAIGCFERAIGEDPRFARAYASLAYCYGMLPILKAVLPSEFVPKMRVIASKALEIDAGMGEAHIAMALPLIHDYEWQSAGQEFSQGLALCPCDVVGHAWYGTFLANVGRGEEALREHARVLALDPASPPAQYCYGQTLYFLRRYDEAADQFRKALALDASFPRAHAGLGLACIQKGSHLRGVAELERAQELTPGLGRVKADLAYGYAVAGQRDKAQAILSEFLGQFAPASFPALMIAEIFIGLGDQDSAFEWLHRAVDQKDISAFLGCDPLYDPLRSDPRFTALLKRTNLA